MNIVFASDDKGVDMMAVAIYSVIKNNQKHKLNFYIIHTRITAHNQKRTKKLEQKFANTSIKFILADKNQFKGINTDNPNVTMEAYYRYLAPDVIPKGEDRALCMDFDMLCVSDLGELYNTDLGSNYIGGIEDYVVTHQEYFVDLKDWFSDNGKYRYINSGLLLMDLKKIRNKMPNSFWDNLKNKSKLIPKNLNIFADQTIANITYKGKIKYLDKKYNVFTTVLKELNVKEPAILHFTGSAKPLMYRSTTSSEYDDLYLINYIECINVIGFNSSSLVKNAIQRNRKEYDHRIEQEAIVWTEKNRLLSKDLEDHKNQLRVANLELLSTTRRLEDAEKYLNSMKRYLRRSIVIKLRNIDKKVEARLSTNKFHEPLEYKHNGDILISNLHEYDKENHSRSKKPNAETARLRTYKKFKGASIGSAKKLHAIWVRKKSSV